LNALSDETFAIAQYWFVKGLALNYLSAFASLFVQVLGLYGSKGIVPISVYLQTVKRHFNKKAFLEVPTVFWWNSSDHFIRCVAALGMLFAALACFGVFPSLMLILLWCLYLSFMSVGSSFLSFQWDCLLLEVGFSAILFSLLTPPPFLLVVLMWVLLFRLMFSSGVVKLLSGCPEWAAWRAMTIHYESQPLPNPIAYFMHQQPKWFAKVSVLFLLFIEIIVPFFIFAPEPMRLAACFLMIFLQILIMLTGNYAFFNTLTIVMCLPLLSDQRWSGNATAPTFASYGTIEQIAYGLLSLYAAFMIVMNAFVVAGLFTTNRGFNRFRACFEGYYILNGYGLFACMTTVRNEITIQGSNDGKEWKTYEFKWKPGDLKTMPKQVAPHQPRLDWQMWFAALGSPRQEQWFTSFLQRLREGSDDVLNLLKTNPFPEAPPKFLRTKIDQYHFTDTSTLRQTGEWWKL